MPECKTINCPNCNLQLEETFVEQKCPRCQTLIESKFICGSCHNCGETIDPEKDKDQKTRSSLSKIFLLFTGKS